MRQWQQWVVVGAVALLIAACGGGSDGGAQDSNVLAGDPGSRAVQALADIEPTPAASQDVAGAYLLTRISVVLKRDATVANLNAAARAVGSTAISFSRPGSPFMTLAIPRQTSGAALNALARQLESQPGILFASAGRQVELLEIPAEGGVASELRELDHLLATRFPAAWNVRHLALTPNGDCASKVTVIYPDFFLGKPTDFDGQMEGAITADPRTREPAGGEAPQPHGYNTVATLAAKFDATLSTGANPLPKCLKIKLVDGRGISLPELIDKTIQAVQQEPGRVLVSSAVGYKNSFICGPDGTDECAETDIGPSATQIRTNIREHFVQGILWASFAMRPDVADRMLVVQAAGNDGSAIIGSLYPGLRSARLGSPFSIATALGDLDTVLADRFLWRPMTAAPELPDLSLDAETASILAALRDLNVTSPVTDRNVILVGSVTNAPLAASVVKHDLSDDGATLFAVGKDVSTIDFGVRQGTSFAAPQVAGLVSYLWLLEPTLINRPLQDTIRALQANAQNNAALTGIVDAYATVLSLDRAVAPTPATARMRLAVLDVDGNGRFDLEDLRRFHDAYVASGQVLDPAVPDYSRFDLNGDGFTGGTRATKMDLDPTGSVQFGAPLLREVSVAVDGVERVFNENAVTDAQALCYYANTALFDSPDQAARDARDALLRDLCFDSVRITTASLPAAVVNQAYQTELTASGGVPPFTWRASNLPQGLTIDSASGRINGIPDRAETRTVIVDVTSAGGGSDSVALPLTVVAPVIEGKYVGTTTWSDNIESVSFPRGTFPAEAFAFQTLGRIRIALRFGPDGVCCLDLPTQYVFAQAADGSLTLLGAWNRLEPFGFVPLEQPPGGSMEVRASIVGGLLRLTEDYHDPGAFILREWELRWQAPL